MLHKLIQEAQSQGVYLYTEKGALKYRSSKGKLSAELGAALKENKATLIDFLNQHQQSDVITIPTNTQLTHSALTFSQNRVFYLEKMNGNDSLYHMTSAFRIKGHFDLKRIEETVNRIIARHSILRTGFEMIEDTPTQRCYEKSDVSCEMSIEIKSNQPESVWLAEQANRPFDLSRPPLVRLSTRQDDIKNESIVLFVFHHLAFDGYSYSCFFSELNAIFAQMGGHKHALLPELAFQYADFAQWQQSENRRLSSSTVDFWSDKMAGVNDLNSFPTDYSRTADLNSDGALLSHIIDSNTTARIKTFAQNHGVSLFSLMSTVYAILVSRWTGNPDVVIGTPVAGREVPGTEHLIGFFANTLILRSDISLDKTFTELLEVSKKNLADSFRHQNMPFEKIVESAAHDRSHLNAPILQLLFVVNQVEKQPLNMKGCEIESIIVDRMKINFEFELHVNDHGDTLEIYWLYAEKLFSRTTAEAIKNSFMTLLDNIIENTAIPVSQLPLVTPSGLDQIQKWNQTDQAFLKALSFTQGFESSVLQYPNANACFGINTENEHISLSYSELNSKANRLAHYLIAHGAQPERCIGMAYAWSIDAVISIIAILKSGAAYVPLDGSQPKERLKHIVESADINLLLATDELITTLAMSSVHSIDIASLDTKERLNSCSDINPEASIIPFDSSNLAYVIFTSGSTGKPKGVMVEHKNLNNMMASLQGIIHYQANDVVASMTAPSFDIHVAEILLPLMQGASIAVLNWAQTRSPKQIQASIEKHEISIMQATPAIWQLLVDNGFKAKSDFKMITGGDHLSANLRQSLLSDATTARLYNLYAPSEATVYCSGNETNLAMPKVHIGHPFPNNRFYILDDALNHQPIGCKGELFIAGANIARGYLGKGELTKQLFTQDPFIGSASSKMYRTGDLARRLDDGTVELLGRKDFQLKINGIRVEASDIESHLLSLIGVEQALVTLNNGVNEERHLVAYLIAETKEKLDFERIRTELSLLLPSALLPSYFVELEEFPLTQNLKIDRKALPSPNKTQVKNEVQLAQTDTEKRVSVIWETCLNLKNIDIKTNFFSLGGHSLLAIKMVSQVSREMNLDISLKSLIDASTIAQFSRHINTLTAEHTQTHNIQKIDLGKGEKPKQLSFSQLRLWGLDSLDAKGKHYCVPLKYTMNGTIDKNALSQTFDLIRVRHETLRTAYSMGENEPQQTVINANRLKPVLIYQDSQHDSNKSDTLRQFEFNLFEKPFNLKSGEVFRAGLIRLDDACYQLFIAIHHIAIDGESLPILLHEISESYQAIKHKRAPNLTTMAIQYCDYAYWQREKFALRSDELSTSESYWKKRLLGIKPTHGLTLDFPRPEHASYAGENHYAALSDDLSNKVMTLASSKGVTPFTLIYSAFCVLLSRYTGLNDVVIGTPVANRTEVEIEGLIGFFVNSLALRNELAHNITFNDLLLTTQKNLLADFDHQSLPFEKVLQVSDSVRRFGHHPIFQIMIVLEQESDEDVSLDQVKLLPLSPQSVEARFDITLGIKLSDQKIHLNWNYATDIFKQETITDMAQHFQTLIAVALNQPDENVFELPFMSDLEHAHSNLIQHDSFYARETLVTLFNQQCEQSPTHIALTYNEETLTFLELQQKSNQLANALISNGAGKGKIVAIKLERSNHMIIAMLAVLKSGAAYLPIDMNTPQKRLEFVLKDSHACILFTEQYSSQSDVQACHQIVMSEFNVDSFSIQAPDLSSPITHTDLAYVIYTSGSTGQPKGVLIEHKGVVNYINQQAQYLALTDDDICDKAGFLYLTSFAFDTSVASIWGALSSGRNLHILSEEKRFDLETINQCLCQPDKYGVAYIPPILLAELDPAANKKLIPRVVVSGEAVSQALVNQYLTRTVLINEYGPTENSVCSTFHRYKQGDPANLIGQCIGGVNAFVLDAFCNPVPYGVSGELYLSGAGLGRGYLNQKALTESVFIETVKGFNFPLYKTGDLVKRQRDGSLLFEGRIDDQVKIRGFRIELGEIEQQIQSHQDVQSVKLVVLTGDNGHQQLASFVISTHKEDALFIALSHQLSLTLPDYMVPKLWAQLDAWPLTTNGKLDKAQLPKPNPITQSQILAPKTDIEHSLTTLWQNLLKIDDVNLNDNFFSLGGDSIISMQLVARASQLGLYFSVKTLFEYPSIASLIPNITRQKIRQVSQDASIGHQALLPIQHEFFHFAPVDKRDHFNQSTLLTIPSDFTLDLLIDCVNALVGRHDALRLMFEPKQAYYHDLMDGDDICSETYLAVMDKTTLTNLCNQIHQTLNIQDGPLIKAVRIYSDSDIKLFIVIHHVVIDAVSWQILIEDLIKLYQHKLAGKGVELAAKTDSYQTWVNMVNAPETLSYFDNHERHYWQKVLNSMPLTHALNNKKVNKPGARDNAHLILNEKVTQMLLNQANRAYNTETQELILIGIYLGLNQWKAKHDKTGTNKLSFTIETHGRDGLNALLKSDSNHHEIDISQTLGWFSSTYPFVVEAPDLTDFEQVICHIKETFRQVPNNGLGYSILKWLSPTPLTSLNRADILFNYFGQTDLSNHALEQGEAQSVYCEQLVTDEGAFNHMQPHCLAINGRISNGQLNLDLNYDTELFSKQVMSGLRGAIDLSITALVNHCSDAKQIKYTPSDFPLAFLEQRDIDQWQAKLALSSLQIKNIYPATGMQEGLLYHSQIQSDAYITQLTLSYGTLNPLMLEASWKHLITRHDIFRTAFMTTDRGDKYQVVTHRADLEWHYINLSSGEFNTDDVLTKLEDLKIRDKQQCFDLNLPCLMRLTLAKVTEDSFKLIWTNHHALIDGWCLPILLSELSRIYTSFVETKPLTLKESPSYANFIKWLQTQDTEQASHYWTSRLETIENPTKLPFHASSDSKLASIETVNDGYAIQQQLRLSKPETNSLKVLSQNTQCTLNTIVQAAWGLLLAKYSDTNTIMFGTTVSGRSPQVHNIEKMVGLCINTLPVIMQIDDRLNLKTWLKGVHENHVQAESFSYLPLHDIQQLSPLSKQGLFESLLVFENYPIDQDTHVASEKPLNLVSLESHEETNYPISLVIVEQDDIELKLLSNTQYLQVWQAKQVLKHLKQLLLEMVKPSTLTLGDIALLSKSDISHQLHTLNPPHGEHLQQSLSHCFEHEVQQNPHKIALVSHDKNMSYRELNEQANRLAHYLIAQGVTLGNNIGIYTKRSSDMVVSMLAVIKAGACYVPLDASYPQSRLDYMVDTAGINIILCDDSVKEDAVKLNARYIKLSHLPSGLSHENVDVSGQSVSEQTGLDLAAYVMFTSGSTGRPKGVVIPHHAVIRLVKNSNYVNLDSRKTIAQINNFSFDATTFEIWGALLNGARLVILSNEQVQSPLNFADKIQTHDIDVVLMTTALVNQMVTLIPDIFKTLDILLFGGEKVDKQTIDTIINKGKPNHLVHIYGPTENTTFSSYNEISEIGPVYPIGKPISQSSTYILSSQRDLLAFGQVGELYVGGKGLSLGYLNQPHLTQDNFVPSPFNPEETLYRTGDLVRYLENGDIEFEGRRDDQFKLRGYRIERLEILAQLLEFTPVAHATVELIKRTDNALVCVALTLKEHAKTQAEKDNVIGKLNAHMTTRLPAFMIPSEYHLYEELPVTQNGKLDRHKIQALLISETGSKQVNTASPRDDIEMALYKIWLGILLNKEIGIKDNFFDIGGSSISAIKVIHNIEKHWSVSISVADMLTFPTIEALGGIIRQKKQKGETTTSNELIQFRAGDGEVNVICPHLGGGTAFGYLSLAKVLPDDYGVYGIQAKGVDTDEAFLPNVQAMADYYLTLVNPMVKRSHVFLGCSYGGYVAFEMARLVQEAGHDSVAILLDSDGTNDQTILDQIKPVSLAVFRQKLITYNGMYPNIDDQQIDRYFRVYNHHLTTLKTMSLANTKAKTILVLATGDKSPDYMQSLTDYWSKKVEGDLIVEKVEGDHSTMLEAPSILKVADIIRAELN